MVCLPIRNLKLACRYSVYVQNLKLCYVMLCYVMLCYVMLCYVMLCYVMLCYVMLCYVMLCHVMSIISPTIYTRLFETGIEVIANYSLSQKSRCSGG